MNSDLQYFFSSKWIQATAECPIEQQGGAPLFLRSFTVKEKVQRAALYITALGIFECFLNAKRTDDTLFNPGWTDYAKRVQYCTFDVTDQIVQGKNDFAVLLGAGWYAGHSGMSKPAFYGSAVPKCKFCLCLHYDSDRDEYIQSDAETLVTRDGPITYNDHLMGETYDGTRPSYAELLQRQDTAFDKCIVNTNIHTKPTPFLGEPIRVLDTLQAVSVQFQTKNTAVIDFGQNSVGVVELRLRAKRGLAYRSATARYCIRTDGYTRKTCARQRQRMFISRAETARKHIALPLHTMVFGMRKYRPIPLSSCLKPVPS